MDLPTALRQRVFELLDGVRPQSRYKVLVLDEKVELMLKGAVETGEILNREVAAVQRLAAPRKAEPYLDAIYLVEDNSFSYACIEADFNVKRYAGAHIFLLPRWRASQSERQKFAHTCRSSTSGMALKHIETLPFAFLALEKRLFSLNFPKANLVLYNQQLQAELAGFVELTSLQLAQLCGVLKVDPYIRFAAGVSALPALVAGALSTQTGANTTTGVGKRSTLLVLDRSFDTGAPLRHSVLFQALSRDLTDGKGAPPAPASDVPPALQGRTLGIKFEPFEGGYPDEKDKLWRQVRHEHVVAAAQQLTAALKELRAANPQFEQEGDLSVGDVRNMLAALPEFMRARESIGLNLDLAHDCISALEQPHFQSQLLFEQACALGTNEDGTPQLESALADQLVQLLAMPQLPRKQKVRLLTLYALHRRVRTNQPLCESDYERLMRHAQLQKSDIDCVKAVLRLASDQQLLAELPQQPFRFHRVKPGLQSILQLVLQGELSDADFPYAGETPDKAQEAMSTATSLRSHRQKATWAQSVGESEKKKVEAGAFGGSQKTLIVFMLGGFTASEAAAVYKIAEESHVQIFLGGHDFLTPNAFLEFAGQIDAPADSLELPEEPAANVPEFLLKPPAAAKPTNAKQAPSQPPNGNHKFKQQQQPQQQQPPPPAHQQMPVTKHKKPKNLIKTKTKTKLNQTSQVPQAPQAPQQVPQQVPQAPQHIPQQVPQRVPQQVPQAQQVPQQVPHAPQPVSQVPQRAQPAPQAYPQQPYPPQAYPQQAYPQQAYPQQTFQQAPPQAAPPAAQNPYSGYTESGIMYLGAPPKEKKDMKKRLKGAFSALKR